MSRTYRRKNGRNKYWKWIDSREEFEESQAIYLAQEWRELRYNSYTGRYYYSSWYNRAVTHYRDYDQYIAAEKARYHGDRGWWGGGVPSAFVNTFCNRPLRQRHRAQIRRAWDNDTWDELSLDPYTAKAAWLYW